MYTAAGVISFYLDFLESLYVLLDGTASVTGKIQFHILNSEIPDQLEILICGFKI